MTNRWNANACAELAEAGVFVEIGQKCHFCLHALAGGGCRLRLLAKAAT